MRDNHFFYVCDVLDYINYQQTDFYVSDFFDRNIETCEDITSSNLLRSVMQVLPFGKVVNSSLV